MHATNKSTGGEFAACKFGTCKFGACKFARGKCGTYKYAAGKFRSGKTRAKLAGSVGEMRLATKGRAAASGAILTP
jgi:hypothetical protein